MTSESASNPPEVSVLSRGLSILRTFAPRNGWLSNHQIADAVGLPRDEVLDWFASIYLNHHVIPAAEGTLLEAVLRRLGGLDTAGE